MFRRDFLALTTAARAFGQAPAVITSEAARPQAKWGVQIGDVVPGRAMLWTRADRPARMLVEYDTTDKFTSVRRIAGAHALEPTDFTARVELPDLPSGRRIFYRVLLRSLADGKTLSEPVLGSFRTPPAGRGSVRFIWSGDTAGQGYGINPDWGGMRMYKTLRERAADFFIHSGDTIYADVPIPSEIKRPDGSVWRNITTEAKSKPAETLADFRGNYLYNLLDDNVRAFNAETPQIWAWDDHEVMNNWFPGKDLSNAPHGEKSVSLLAARAARAFLEYAPMRHSAEETERVYRAIPYGPLLDVFVIDMRSYRGPNTYNRQTQPGEETDFLGRTQMNWLKSKLAASKALWKVIAADMPVGLMVGDGLDASGRQVFEASANGNGPPLGREFEIAGLLQSMKQNKVKNVIWLTADVHYTAAHRYHPSKAQFTDFDPFWEFVSGPLNSGTFGPGALDNTFGPEVVFHKAPPKGQSNLPPSAGMQFFGEVEIEGRTGEMTVRLKDLTGAALFTQRIPPG
jgi:alkaline phosphatase D